VLINVFLDDNLLTHILAKIRKYLVNIMNENMWLKTVKTHTQEKPNAVIVDIDNTVMSNVTRKSYIIRSILKKSVTDQDVYKDYGLTNLLSEDDQEVFFRHFLLPETLVHDTVINGSSRALKDWLQNDLHIVFLSGRPQTLYAATLLQFRENGIPIPDGERVHLFLKDDNEISDLEFKERTIRKLQRQYNFVAGIGDLPDDATVYRKMRVPSVVLLGQFSVSDFHNLIDDNLYFSNNWHEVDEIVRQLAEL